MKDSWLTPFFSSRHRRDVVAGLLFCLALTGCGVTSPTPKSEDAADFALTAEELEAEFRQDEKAAAKKYEGKTIELRGVVESMYGDEPSFLGLYRGPGLLGLPCEMMEKESWAKVSFGQHVKVRGRLSEDRDSPSLCQCAIVETGPNRTVRLSAVQLATEYAADPQGTKQKYAGKPLIVSGEVVEDLSEKGLKKLGADVQKSSELLLKMLGEVGQSIIDGGQCSSVFLKGTKKVRIRFNLRAAYEHRRAEMTTGKQVIIFAVASDLCFFDNEITFYNALLITK